MEWVTGETITAEKLNAMGVLWATDTNGVLDKTGNEIKEAFEEGRHVLVKSTDSYGTQYMEFVCRATENVDEHGEWSGFSIAGTNLYYVLFSNESMDDYMHIYD